MKRKIIASLSSTDEMRNKKTLTVDKHLSLFFAGIRNVVGTTHI